jgi:signal transduction histidine kinase
MLNDLRRHADELRASRERIVATADAERRRVERDLHDGAQQHLVLLNLKLTLIKRSLETDPPAAAAMVEEATEDLGRALADLRDLAHGIYPVALENDGLLAALKDAAAHAAIRTDVECDGAGRYRPELEAAVWFCCLEALQNAAKQAGEGAHANVRIAERDGAVHFEVADDGVGYDTAQARPSAGVQNMTDRIGALGGELQIRSAPGRGTNVHGTIPVDTSGQPGPPTPAE